MISKNIPDIDYLYPGHVACPGCGAAIAMKFALKALGEKTVVVIPASCWGVISGAYPQTSLKVPILHAAFELFKLFAALNQQQCCLCRSNHGGW